MNTLTSTSFYVQKPCDEFWNTPMKRCVIEAESIDISETRKISKYAEKELRVINPKDFANDWSTVHKCRWIECPGPVRKLEFREYVQLYHSLKPEHPLPEGWKERKPSMDEELNHTKAICNIM